MGILRTNRALGAFDCIDTVDLTELHGCNVQVVAGEPSTTVGASGPRWGISSVEVEHTSANGINTLVVRRSSSRGLSATASNTGTAKTGPGGYANANTGYDGPIRPGMSVTVRNTGDASATGPGSCANTGVSRGRTSQTEKKTTIVRDHKPLTIDRQAQLTVKIVVSPGAKVFYL
ncbi:MAG: hypothetical protein PVI21_05675 [Candidatus Woesebacteria bacterium]|jgi:hypothetical protein